MLGGILIGIWGGFKNKSYTLAFSTFGAGIVTCTLGLVTNFWIYIVIMGLSGVFMAIFNPPMMTIMQTNIEANYMGRVFSLLTMISSVTMPLGMVLWGPLSDIIKIDWLLLGTGIRNILTCICVCS